MEDLYGNNTRMIMRRTQISPDAMTNEMTANTKFLQRQNMLSQSQEATINELLECIRDASSTENVRAIQDSET